MSDHPKTCICGGTGLVYDHVQDDTGTECPVPHGPKPVRTDPRDQTIAQLRSQLDISEKRWNESTKDFRSQSLTHGMNCAALAAGMDDDCTCGLSWRIQLQTEQELCSAWRKRATEAEREITQLRSQLDKSQVVEKSWFNEFTKSAQEAESLRSRVDELVREAAEQTEQLGRAGTRVIELEREITQLRESLLVARLEEALDVRAAYHGADEFGRQFAIVKYMDKRVSDLEAAIAKQRAEQKRPPGPPDIIPRKRGTERG